MWASAAAGSGRRDRRRQEDQDQDGREEEHRSASDRGTGESAEVRSHGRETPIPARMFRGPERDEGTGTVVDSMEQMF